MKTRLQLARGLLDGSLTDEEMKVATENKIVLAEAERMRNEMEAKQKVRVKKNGR